MIQNRLHSQSQPRLSNSTVTTSPSTWEGRPAGGPLRTHSVAGQGQRARAAPRISTPRQATPRQAGRVQGPSSTRGASETSSSSAETGPGSSALAYTKLPRRLPERSADRRPWLRFPRRRLDRGEPCRGRVCVCQRRVRAAVDRSEQREALRVIRRETACSRSRRRHSSREPSRPTSRASGLLGGPHLGYISATSRLRLGYVSPGPGGGVQLARSTNSPWVPKYHIVSSAKYSDAFEPA